MLVCIKDEKRVDELPKIMEKYPLKAVLAEQIKDCEFQFLANACSHHEQYAWAMQCDKTQTGFKIVDAAMGRIKPVIIDKAPCKEVILKGDEVDLTKPPLFVHHDRDGHAYTDDNSLISKNLDTGVYDWGIYRSMFRTTNCKTSDRTYTSHRQRIHALIAAKKGKNLEMAIVIGGSIVDKLAALQVCNDDFEVLGSFYGHAAQLVKCETIDVLMPANAEIVLECELLTLEGWVHDEGSFGEFSGMYGG